MSNISGIEIFNLIKSSSNIKSLVKVVRQPMGLEFLRIEQLIRMRHNY